MAQPVLEKKPVPIDEVNHWQIKSEGKLVTIAYYQHFRFPDGSRGQLKSKTLLDKNGWEALAKNYWAVIQEAELNQPEPCTRCGGTGVEP